MGAFSYFPGSSGQFIMRISARIRQAFLSCILKTGLGALSILDRFTPLLIANPKISPQFQYAALRVPSAGDCSSVATAGHLSLSISASLSTVAGTQVYKGLRSRRLRDRVGSSD